MKKSWEGIGKFRWRKNGVEIKTSIKWSKKKNNQGKGRWLEVAKERKHLTMLLRCSQWLVSFSLSYTLHVTRSKKLFKRKKFAPRNRLAERGPYVNIFLCPNWEPLNVKLFNNTRKLSFKSLIKTSILFTRYRQEYVG